MQSVPPEEHAIRGGAEPDNGDGGNRTRETSLPIIRLGMRDRTIRVGGLRIEVTQHALGNYVDRVKPAFTEVQALAEIVALALLCGHVGLRPGWKRDTPEGNDTQRWLWLTDDIALPLARHDGHHAAMTVVTRGGISGIGRVHRNASRKRTHHLPGKRSTKRAQAVEAARNRSRADDWKRGDAWAA